MPTLERDGVTLFYQDEGQGQPVLLLHGFPLSSDSFWPQLDSPPAGVRLIVPDHRGFGRSGPGEGPAEMGKLASDALSILEALKIPQAVVGGVSMGGYVALALTRLDPSKVKALVLIDTQATADDEAGKARREETARAVESRGVEVLVESMMPKLLAPDAPAALKARVEALIRANSAKGMAAALRGMALRQDCKDILARFAGPTLVVVGDKDAITPPEKAKELASLVEGARLVQLPGAGHLSNLEAPAAFNRALEDFLFAIPWRK
ncbi:MAG: alpha/beta fold hydrolase [Myxococcaceae bacterium]